jgi:hypothetical protein
MPDLGLKPIRAISSDNLFWRVTSLIKKARKDTR